MSLIYKNSINSGVFPDLMSFQYTKTMINVPLIATAPFLYYQFVERYLNVFCITLYSCTLKVTTCQPHISWNSVLMTIAYNNYCQLYLAFMQILIITHRLKFEKRLISQNHSTKYAMKVYYTNLNLLTFQEIFLIYFAVSWMSKI